MIAPPITRGARIALLAMSHLEWRRASSRTFYAQGAEFVLKTWPHLVEKTYMFDRVTSKHRAFYRLTEDGHRLQMELYAQAA